MATVKIKPPGELTGDIETDIQMIRSYQMYLAQQLNYTLNNLDSENMISEEEV